MNLLFVKIPFIDLDHYIKLCIWHKNSSMKSDDIWNTWGTTKCLNWNIYQPMKAFVRWSFHDFANICSYELLTLFWTLKSKICFPLFISRHGTLALTKFYSPSYHLRMHTEMQAHNMRVFKNIWWTQSIDL